MRFTRSIRPVTQADMLDIAALIDAVGLFPSELLSEMILPFFNGSNKQDRWITVDQAGPIAVAYWAPERMTLGTWNLLLIAVLPRMQRAGIGAALLSYVESELATAGQRVLLVETSGLPQFDATRAFYRSCGYEEEARIRDYYDAGDDKLVFRKALATRLV